METAVINNKMEALDSSVESTPKNGIENERPKPLKILRCESPRLSNNTQEIDNFSKLINDRIGVLVDSVKQWWDGGFGNRQGEDASFREQMQTFTAVALENILAMFLVRVFSHLERGGLSVSAAGCICGARRKKESENSSKAPYERAQKINDQQAVSRFETYLSIVDQVDSSVTFKPLKFLTEWRNELGSEWVDLIVDDAAQYLRGHIKKLDKWNGKEADRTKDLEKFKSSRAGKKYLEIRREHFEHGLPRNNKERFAILNNENVLRSWDKKEKLNEAQNLRTLLEKNPKIKEICDNDYTYSRLIKPFTEPSWTPVTQNNPRWVFIPTDLFEKNGIRRENGHLTVDVTLPLVKDDTVIHKKLSLNFAATDRIAQMRPVEKTVTCFTWPDSVTGQSSQITIKGMRIELDDGKWRGRFSYQKQASSFSDHVNEVLEAQKNRVAPNCSPGDKICVFALNAQSKGNGKNKRIVGWLKVLGVEQEGTRTLYSKPVYATIDPKKPTATLKRGGTHLAFDKAKLAKHNNLERVTSRGAVKGVTLPQMLHVDRNLKRDVKFLRLLKDPERREEAVEWLDRKIAASEKHNKNPAATERLKRLAQTLRSGGSPSHTQLKPFKQEIKAARDNLKGLKDNFRHVVAKKVLIMANQARTGRLEKGIHEFNEKHHGNGSVFLVTQYQKGKGAGPFKQKPQNKVLSVLGVSTIYQQMYDLSDSMEPRMPLVKIASGILRRACPACDHVNATNPKGNDFKCGSDSCGKSLPTREVEAFNLAKLFFSPPPKVNREIQEVEGEDS